MARYINHLKIFTFVFVVLLLAAQASAQVYVRGTVKDNEGIVLQGATVQAGSKGAITDAAGTYTLAFPDNDTITLLFTCIGFEPATYTAGRQDSILNVVLKPSARQLDQVVVTAGRYGQELKRVTVSTDLIRPYLIENKVTVNMENIMNQLPSVNVVDGQVNIRGGSGWTYGAGSRVLVLLDDLPYQTGDAGQVQWKFLPVENLEQIEVIKGASSVLYGSSALNGVINIRTAAPKQTPQFSLSTFAGVYNQLPRDSTRWNQTARYQYGFNAFQSQRIKQLDLVTSIAYLKDEGYRFGEDDQRFRVSVNTNYHSAKIAGMSYGVNASVMEQSSSSFLLWESFQQSYTAQDSAKTLTKARNISIDPHLDFQALGLKHRFRSRVLSTRNDNTAADTSVKQSTQAVLVYAEYQVQKFLPRNIGVITAGIAGSHTESNSPLFGGTHTVQNLAPFLQADLNYKRLTYSMGVRSESFRMDGIGEQRTIFRTGASYGITRSTFARASYGQGYRFPSIAERYITTSAGTVNVFPNPNLRSESGWSAELGIKQGFKMGSWQGYADAAWFITQYNDMVEFNFGLWKPVGSLGDITKSLGFRSLNVGKTQISGIDLSLLGAGSIGKVTVKTLIGYTYTNPISLEPDKVFATDSFGNKYSYRSTSVDSSINVLKYRYRHLFKADVELGYRKFSAGVSVRYNSYMDNIDNIFITLVPGLQQGRALNTSGDILTDLRAGYKPVKWLFINFVVNNISNHEQMTRPADMRPPRMYIVQLNFKF